MAYDGKEFGIDSTAWDIDDLSKVGLMKLLSGTADLEHELKYADRGSYVGIGDTPEHLVYYLRHLGEKFIETASNIEREL
jgi:hypothetical protein